MEAIAAESRQIRPDGAGRAIDDEQLIGFIGRHGAVGIGHVMALCGVGRAMAYRRVAPWIERGLLERLDLVRGKPSLLRATSQGLRYAGLGLGVARLSPGSVNHWLCCASTGLVLGRQVGTERVWSARELVFNERLEGRAIASAKVGQLPDGQPRLHRPDLVVASGERPVAVEVELTAKAPARLAQIVRAWRRASWVKEVHYYCAPGAPRRAVEAAVAKTRAGDFVRIEEVPQI